MTVRGTTIRIAAATLAAAAIAAPTAVLAAGSYNTRADVRTLMPAKVTTTSARLGALVAPNGVAVRVTLEITTKRSTRTVTLGTVAARAPLATLRKTVTGLKPGTKYTVRANAVNGGKKTSPGTTVSLTTKR
jgi:phosphodiesterase/alkaline phosphatase D-like protein